MVFLLGQNRQKGMLTSLLYWIIIISVIVSFVSSKYYFLGYILIDIWLDEGSFIEDIII